MTLSILSGAEPIEVASVVVTIFGQPGVFKSSLGYSSAENPLLLDFDGGAHRAINRRPETKTVRMKSWEDLLTLYKDHRDDVLAKAGAVAVDTVGRCLDMAADAVIRDNPKHGQSDGSLALKGWGALRQKWSRFETTTRQLGHDLILIAHDKETDAGEGKIVRPDIQGGAYGEVVKSSDAIGYCYMVGKKRMLDFSPNDRWIGKNPAGWKPFEVPHFNEEPLFLRHLLDRLKAHLNAQSEANATAIREADRWREQIAAVGTVPLLNALLPQVNALKPPLRDQVASLVIAHAKANGWNFDATSKTFTDPEAGASKELFA